MSSLRSMILLMACFACLASPTRAADHLFGKSYALVVGIKAYASGYWPTLSHGIKDAEAIEAFLETQGYEIETLYDEQATRENILWKLGGEIAPKLTGRDRVLIFFSGHGETREVGWRDYGYIIPYDGTDKFSSWISMAEMRELSQQMLKARHQLFIFDSCYGGSIGRKAGPSAGNTHPRYIEKVSANRARQFLTAGGKDEQVLADGPHGYSYFTGFLLDALKEGKGDLNEDSYVTMSELAGYLLPAASNLDHTPRWGILPEHEQGEYWFRVPNKESDILTAGTMPEQSASAAHFKGKPEAEYPAGEIEAVEPETLTHPQGPLDNLMLIKGVGNTLQAELHELGIYHFWQIARWTNGNLLWIKDNTIKIKGRAKPSWVDDAKRLMKERDAG